MHLADQLWLRKGAVPSPLFLLLLNLLFHAAWIMTGHAAGMCVRYRHGFIRINSLHENIILPWHGKEMGGNVVHPVIFPVPCIDPFAESSSGLRCFWLVAAGAGNLGFLDCMRRAHDGFRMLGNISLFSMTRLAVGIVRGYRVRSHLMLER